MGVLWLMGERIEGPRSQGTPDEASPREERLKADFDFSFGDGTIPPYSFFAPEQFHVSARYFDACDEVSGGSCWSWCYRRVWLTFDKISDQLRRRPVDEDVVQQLDAGHTSFYLAMCRAKEEGLLTDEKLKEAETYWRGYFDEWSTWFKSNYPKYFWPHIEDRETR